MYTAIAVNAIFARTSRPANHACHNTREHGVAVDLGTVQDILENAQQAALLPGMPGHTSSKLRCWYPQAKTISAVPITVVFVAPPPPGVLLLRRSLPRCRLELLLASSPVIYHCGRFVEVVGKSSLLRSPERLSERARLAGSVPRKSPKDRGSGPCPR